MRCKTVLEVHQNYKSGYIEEKKIKNNLIIECPLFINIDILLFPIFWIIHISVVKKLKDFIILLTPGF